MNKRQKIVQQQFIGNEEKVIKRLKQVYGESLKSINAKTAALQDEIEALTSVYDKVEDEAEKEILKSRIRSKVYQKTYQESLQKQVSDILDKMQNEEFSTVAEYLNTCYEDGFVGTMYDLQGQGIPLCFPLDQEAVTRAVQLDSKISQGLYSRLGEDVDILKKKITAQVSRGIATGMSFAQVARQLAAYSNIGFNNAVRIARTEGHRIQVQSGMDACYKAKEKGADVVKQWDSTLDAKTRDSHVRVDGEVKELDEKFSNGLMFPGDPSGKAAEVINCRCALLQRARWAVKGGFTKMNNFTKEIETFESPEAYDEFKKGFFSKENKRYMNYVHQLEEKYGTTNFQAVMGMMNDREYKHMTKLLEANPVFNKDKKTNSGIVEQEEIRARRAAYRQRQLDRQKTANTPDFDSMDRKQLELWATQNLKTSFVDIKGANVEYVRDAVKVINEFEGKMGSKTIDGLVVQFGNSRKNTYAYYDDKTKTVHLKKSGNKTSFEERQRKTNERSQTKLGKNYHATETYSGTLWHEIGHAVDADTDQALSKMLSTTKELDAKSVKVSVYAGSQPAIGSAKRSEAWAENFAAYMDKGTTAKDVPPEIVEMIEGYFKGKTK